MVEWAAAQHLISPFSSPCCSEKIIFNYGYREISLAEYKTQNNTTRQNQTYRRENMARTRTTRKKRRYQ
jgi:hypothetical protein